MVIWSRGSQSVLEKRRSERLPVSLPVSYLIEAPARPLEGRTTTIDLSRGGLQFTIPTMVSPQTPCRCELTLPDHPAPLTFRGHVVWCRLGGTGKIYEVGIAFVDTPTETDPDSAVAVLCRFIATRLVQIHLGCLAR